jgi:hypothetical protein
VFAYPASIFLLLMVKSPASGVQILGQLPTLQFINSPQLTEWLHPGKLLVGWKYHTLKMH